MGNPEPAPNTSMPRWVKASAVIAILLGLLFVTHIFFADGMSGLHSMPTGG
jgi:uncharacterized membrane protein HdeD (DUF308 family)